MKPAFTVSMRVLVATDLSDAADVALREGAALAPTPQDAIAVIHASLARGWVLAATDLSESSYHAITAGAAEARRRRARLEVVHSQGFRDVEAKYLLEFGTPSVTPTPMVFDAATRELSECVTRLHVDAVCKVIDRPEATAIVNEAEALGAELVVVGARGRTGLNLLSLGSVAESVARTAPCSVLVVRPEPPI